MEDKESGKIMGKALNASLSLSIWPKLPKWLYFIILKSLLKTVDKPNRQSGAFSSQRTISKTWK